ncbi:hypothetical protein [Pseudoneobacillus sp. C159]
MQLFATFESHNYLEIAIAALEKNGVKKESIFAVPLHHRTEQGKLFDTLHRADGTTLFDIGMVLATAFSVIGASLGFNWSWGPIYWGLIGAVIGFMLGVAIRLSIVKVTNKKAPKGEYAGIILIVDCEESKVDSLERILWHHFALGVAKVDVI